MMRIKQAFCAAAALFWLTGCAAKQQETVSPPFFAVRDEATGGCVYMLGSMHAGKKGTVYPDEIMDAFNESPIIACEVDTVAFAQDSAAIAECTEMLLCPDGKTTADYLGESYGEVRDFFKKQGIYNSAYDRYLPAMWSSALSNDIAARCGLDGEYGTEKVFLNLAKKQGKEIIEIETAQQQYALMAEESAALMNYTLECSVNESAAAQEAALMQLYSAWASADGEALSALLTAEQPPEELAADYAEYYAAMYTDRQAHMAECVTEWLSEGKQVFMLVGALHYYAETDIITCLEESGYTVEELSGNKSAEAA